MDGDFKISGRKRYPIHKNGVKSTKDTGNENIGTNFKPLDRGVVFKGKLKYHNIKKLELGAILSALTFHNSKDCYHNIGMAKSLGYGKISLDLDNFENIDEYLREFELNISSQIENWSEKDEIKELLTMASEQDNKGNSKLEHMELENFAKVKNAIESLKQYSKLDGIKIKTLETKLKSEDKELVNKIFEEDRLKIEQIKETEKQKAQLEKDWNIVISSTNIDTLKKFIEKYPNELEKIGKIDQSISKLEDKEKQEKEEKRQKEANEKWLSIKKLESKFMQKALEDFISNYPYFKDIAIVQKELENFSKSSKSSSSNISLDDLKKAKDGKRVKTILEKLKNIDDSQKNEIVEIVKELYSTLGKEQKNFFKDAQIGRFLGKELEEKLKNSI